MNNIFNNVSDLYKNMSDLKKTSGGKITKGAQRKNKVYKRNNVNRKRYIRGGNDGGDSYSCTSCTKNVAGGETSEKFSESPSVTEQSRIAIEPVIPPPHIKDPIVVRQTGSLPNNEQTGGKVKSAKGAYKKYLNKFNLDILQKEAKRKGIKITTKKNGKIHNIKKASLINKIAAKKFSK
jgi:hypothetical protein